MTWRTLHIKDSEQMKLKLDNLEVYKRGQTYLIPLADIAMIVIEGNTSLTTNLLAAFSKHNIAAIVCDNHYLPTGIFLNYGNYHRAAKRSAAQMLWSAETKQYIWQRIIEQKISNQIELCRLKALSEERIVLMEEMKAHLLPGDESNREGHVAKVYFNTLYGLDFTRDDYCIENIAMNFGYAIVRSAIARIVVGQGLMTMAGVFHRNEYNAFNLVDDLMEPFRPLMDYWIHQEVLGKEEFLSYEARLRIIDFINQPMKYKSTKSTVDQVMQKYVVSFIKAMENNDLNQFHEIALCDFIGGNEK